MYFLWILDILVYLYNGIYLYCTNKTGTHQAFVKRAKHDQTFYLILFLLVDSKHRTSASLCYLYHIDIFRYETKNTSFTRQNKLYIILDLSCSWTYTNVYIGIGSTCMYKGHLNITAFNKVRLAHSVERRTTYLRDLGSNPTVGKNFSFCILLLPTRTWQVDWSLTNGIKHDIHARYIDE